MSNCPNRNHPDWITTVNNVGIIDAYRLFTNNNYQIPKIKPFKTYEDVSLHLSSFNKLQKRNDKFYVKFNTPKIYESNLNAVRKEIGRINSMYNGEVLILDSHPITDSKTGRKSAAHVVINEKALVSFWEGFKIDAEKSNTVINEDGDILPFDENMYQQREGWFDDRDTVKDFKRKSEYLLTVFPGYEIVEDTTLTIPGQIDSDGKTIRMNPNLMTRDSIGHEFGHILIDSIGGMANPLIRRARQQLIGHPIERQVLENYPDLLENDPDKLDKEIIAQAIGIESVDLFEDDASQSAWFEWLQRFFNKIKLAIGIESDAVLELSKMLVDKNWSKSEKNASDTLSIDYNKIIKEGDKSEYEKLRQDALDTLYKKKAIKTRHGRDSKTAELERLIKKIESLDENPIESLGLFQTFVQKETDTVYEEYLDTIRVKAEGGIGFTIRKLNKWNNFISGFDAIGEYITMIEQASSDVSNPEEASKIKEALDLDLLREIRDKHSVIKKTYLEEGRNLVAKYLSKYSNHISAKYKESFERDYNKLSKEEKQNISREDYINENIINNTAKINALTEHNIKIELEKASTDISQMQRWVENLLDSPDPVVSSMVNAIIETSRDSRLEQVSLRDNMVSILRELEDFQSSKKGLFKSYKDFYDFMLEKDEDGEYTGNIIDAYSSRLWMDYGKFRNKLEKGRTTYISMQRQLSSWKDKNAPMLPEDKKRFKEDRDAMVKEMHDNNEITNSELVIIESSYKNPYAFELHDKINQDAATKFAQWMRKNSWTYRTPLKKYISNSWHSLVEMAGGNVSNDIEKQIETIRENKNNDPRIKFYNFIKDTLEDVQEKIPYMHHIRDRLPGVVKRGNELIREGDITKGVLQLGKEHLTMLKDEADRGDTSRTITSEGGEQLKFIPIFYTKALEEKDQSYDLADIYVKYFSSAIDYKHKAEILPEMEMARFLVNNRDVVVKDSKGKVRVDALRERELTKSGVSSMVAAQLNDWFDAIIYGEKEKDQGTFGKTRIDKAKFANALGKYTALNMLGFNVVQGTANVMFGSTMQWIEAFGNEHYSPKDFLKAKLVYNKNLGGILGDIGSRKPKNIVNLLNREFDTLNEYAGEKIRRDTKFGQLMTSNTLFFTSHAGEHLMQSKVMLAMLNKLKAKDKDGKVIGTMLSKISTKDGQLVFDPEVANFGDKERSEFEGKMKRVLSALHGEYSEMGRIAIQRGALGRLAYMFRKFVVPGFQRRWGKKRINNISGQYVEGNYLTTGKFFSTLLKDARKMQYSLLSEDWKSLTNTEKANIRRTLGELAFLLSVIVLISFYIEGGDDDDEKRNAFLAYQAYRFRSEIFFFANPVETLKILRSPMASMSLIENSIKLMGQLVDPVMGGDLTFDKYERGNWAGTPKIKKTLINFVPAYKQVYRLKYVEDQISWLK